MALNMGGADSGSFTWLGDGMIVLNALCSAFASLMTRGLGRRVDVFVGTGISQKLNPTRVGLSFNELGFQRVRYHGIRGYLVIQRTAEEMQAYQKGIILNNETEDDLPF